MNWGTKLMIGMGLFMAFIIAMATKMVISGGDDDLVEKDYYEKGLAYDKVYNLKTEAVRDSVIPDFDASQNGLIITFKSPVSYKLVCKRPSDSKLDRLFEGQTADGDQLSIPRVQLKSGPWNIYLSFTVNSKQYLVEREIMMP